MYLTPVSIEVIEKFEYIYYMYTPIILRFEIYIINMNKSIQIDL